MEQFGPNALGETLEPGRVADCYLGLLLPPPPAGEPEAGTVLIIDLVLVRAGCGWFTLTPDNSPITVAARGVHGRAL